MAGDTASNTGPRLLVEAKALGEATAAFAHFLKKRPLGDALLAFHNGKLRIELGGMVQSIAASGTWSGEALLAGQFVLGLVGLPSAGEVIVTVLDQKLLFHAEGTNISRPRTWETSTKPAEPLPMNAGLREKATFGFAHNDDEIERLGLSSVVRPAMEKALISAAAKKLEPLGVSESDLLALVQSIQGHRKDSE